MVSQDKLSLFLIVEYDMDKSNIRVNSISHLLFGITRTFQRPWVFFSCENK